MSSRAEKARELLAAFPNRDDGLGSLAFALTNILEIPADERRRGFKSQVGWNWTRVRTVCIAAGGDPSYVASSPSGRETEALRSKLGKIVYAARHKDDQVSFFLRVAGAEDTPANREMVRGMRAHLDPGSIGVGAALEIVERVT